jgi:hypothetical protein
MMRTARNSAILAGMCLLAACSWALAGPPTLVAGGLLGSPADDALCDATFAPDGTLLLVGNLGQSVKKIGGRKVAEVGSSAEGWQYGCGLVLRLGADGRRTLSALQMRWGAAVLTSVAVGAGGQVYVAGYGSPGVEGLMTGLMRKGRYDQRRWQAAVPREHGSEPRRADAHDQRGVPFVLRLSADLSEVTAGTMLEGWQSCWHVPRPLGEDRWQPVGLVVLPGGDVVVGHDGGYLAEPADGVAGDIEDFYHVGDYVSRLSGDLATRRWTRTIHRPRIDREHANRFLTRISSRYLEPLDEPWPHDSLGQPRLMRMRSAGGDRIFLAGWSPSRTSHEPWWCPFLLQLDGQGEIIASAYTPDPFTGPKGRMGGQVSDSAIRSVAIDEKGHWLVAGIADGGNTMLRRDPRDLRRRVDGLRGEVHSFQGRTLFWGLVARLDGRSQELMGGHLICGWRGRALAAAWPTDLAPAPAGGAVVIGRHTRGFKVTADAWFDPVPGSARGKGLTTPAGERPKQAGPAPMRHGFVRVYDPAMGVRFSASIPHTALETLCRRGGRYAAVGRAWSASAPQRGGAAGSPSGQSDGYFLVMELSE